VDDIKAYNITLGRGRFKDLDVDGKIIIKCVLKKLDLRAWAEYIIGLGSVVGIATGYGLDGTVIESWWGRDFPHLSRPALGPNQPPVRRVPGLSRGKERPGRDADPSPPSSAVVTKG
jgi:hypothetical protein